jgi:hypothetical protein
MSGTKQVLNLRIVQSPLEDRENEAILAEYNRLTSSRIPVEEFVHWTRNSKQGPAWHAILMTDEGRIVGHTSVFPLRTGFGSKDLIAGKSEYSFLHEGFRSEKIRGFEKMSRSAFIIILDQLFQHCLKLGWGPIFASTNDKNQLFTRRVGLRETEFPFRDCLFVLRPRNAAKHTPNLTPRQRQALLVAGTSQRLLWSLARALGPRSNGLSRVRVREEIEAEKRRLSFFEDPDSLEWRYLDEQYTRFALRESPEDYLIAKHGSGDRFLRVCQWRLNPAKFTRSCLATLIREAQTHNAMGVRWAVYDDDPASLELVSRMRRHGFLCVNRVRTVMVHKDHPEFLDRAAWKMNDSLFSFDP